MTGIYTRPTGSLAALSAALVALLTAAGLPLSVGVATAIVVIVIAVVSLLSPRWAEGRSLLKEHPAGVTGAVVTVLTWLAPLVGIDLDPEQAVALVGGVTLLVSFFTPIEDPAVVGSIREGIRRRDRK